VGLATVIAVADEAAGLVHLSFVPVDGYTVRAQATPSTLLADGQSTALITVRVTEAYDYPAAPGTMVTFTTSLGMLSASTGTVSLSPGELASDGIVTTLLTSSLDVGIATVTATAEGAVGEVQVPFVPLDVHTITIQITPSTLPADGHSTAVVTATVFDVYGHTVMDGTPVFFETSLGTLVSSLGATAGGSVTTTLVSSLDVGVATITARVGDVSHNIAVAFVPSEPYTVAMQAHPILLLADGLAASVITATVTDIYAHPVAPGTVVTFATSLGTLSSSSGTVQFPSPSPLLSSDDVVTTLRTSSLDAGIAVVTATAEGAVGTIEVPFVPLDVHTVTVQVYPSILPADGGSTALVTAIVSDVHGQATVDGTPVLFETSLGMLLPSLDTTEAGLVTTTFIAGVDPGRAKITVTTGLIQAFVELDLRARIYLPLVLRH
jgi:adhesin/invasin